MLKRILVIMCFIVPGSLAFSQDVKPDSSSRSIDTGMALSIDTTLDYEDLLSDLDLFLDSLLAPRSYALLSLSGGQGYLNFAVPNSQRVKQVKKFIWSPTFGYYDKGGLGITLSSYMVHDSVRLNSYQFSITPSFDYLKNRDLATGVSYARYITKRNLPFYTSPLQSELNGYFLWRKSWLQPGIMANYGWGSKTEYIRREIIYRKLVNSATADGTIRVLDTVYILRTNRESIRDFSLGFSLRHDFYRLDIFSNRDHIRFSPLLLLSAGTQKFGFNQTTGAIGSIRADALNNTRSISLRQKFQLLSATLYLRSEYSLGKFFIQPQVLFDYYFPGEKKNFTTSFSFNTGFMF